MNRNIKGIQSRRTAAWKVLRSAPLPFAFLLLAACGGGGGGGGSGSGPGSSLTMSVSPQTLSVSATTAQSAPTSSFQVNVTGLTQSQLVYLNATFTTQGISSATFDQGGVLPATVTIQFKPPASLGVGTFNDTVTISACLDQACTEPASNSPQIVQVTYTITKSTFVITALNPSSAYAGAQGVTLTVTGSPFTQQSTVEWAGQSVPTTFVSTTQLTAQIPGTDIANAGSAIVTVNDPAYGTSNTETFTIKPSPVAITTLSPASINATGPSFTLTATGSSFSSQSEMIWNGNTLPTTFVSATQLTAQIPASYIATPGSATVWVIDPTYGISNKVAFTIEPPALAIGSISPTSVTAGGSSFTLTVLGTAFTGTSVVEWNGTGLPTTLVSPTELTAQVPASDISATGTASVTVVDPNSPPGTTSSQTVTIAPASKDAVAFQMNPAHTGSVTFNSVSFPSNPVWSVDVGGIPSYALIVGGKVIVTVRLSTGGNASSEVIALDRTTGNTVWGPVIVSGYTNATYDSGRVFVLSGPFGSAPILEAFDLNTGAIEWSTALTGFTSFAGLPTATDGIVYVGSEYGMNAVDESNGTLLWTKYLGGTDISAAVTVDGIYATYDCQSSDLRPATGEFIWSNNSGGIGCISGMPVVANQLDYSDNAGTGYSGDIFNAGTGTLVGTYVADSPAAFTATMGYFLQSGTLRGVTLANNTVQWSFAGDGQLVGSPVAVNQYVFIGSSSGNLYALDGTTGAQVWNVKLSTAIGASVNQLPFSGLAAGDGLLVVPSGTTVTAYTLSTNP